MSSNSVNLSSTGTKQFSVEVSDGKDSNRYTFGIKSDIFVSTGCISIKDYGFKLYPNPTTDMVTVSMTGLLEQDYTVKVYNCLGHLKLKALKSAVEMVSKIDLSSFTNGTYLIKVITKNQSYQQKIIKK